MCWQSHDPSKALDEDSFVDRREMHNLKVESFIQSTKLRTYYPLVMPLSYPRPVIQSPVLSPQDASLGGGCSVMA